MGGGKGYGAGWGNVKIKGTLFLPVRGGSEGGGLTEEKVTQSRNQDYKLWTKYL